MKYKLPPLQSLRVFESIYRHGSIRKGADELCITPQAASQQLKQLENTLELQLFERGPRGLIATLNGDTLFKHVEQGLDAFSRGIESLQRSNGTRQFHIQVSPYFATQYLIRALPAFTKNSPDLDLRISIGVEMPSFDESDVDAAIVWGYGGIERLDETPLVEDLKVIVASPQLLAEKPITRIEDLPSHRLISPLSHNTMWQDLYEMLGLPPQENHFTQLALHTHDAMLQAVLSGQGVAFLSYVDALTYLNSGRLMAPFGSELMKELPLEKTPKFFLYSRPRGANTAILEKFKHWLVNELCVPEVIGYSLRVRRVAEGAATPV